MILNVEIKARCQDTSFIRTYLKRQDARFVGVDHQLDTYFKVNKGRLKLREGNIENNLIYYDRPNQAGPKTSEILLHPSAKDSSLKNILSKSIGVFTIVDKQREIYFLDNVKFHIDTVKNLGSFVEIEAIDESGALGKAKLLEQCNFYLDAFQINESDLIDCSYSDLMEA